MPSEEEPFRRKEDAEREAKVRHEEELRALREVQEMLGSETEESEAFKRAKELAAELRESRHAQMAAAMQWLEQKWGEKPPCPYCHTSSWTVGSVVRVALAEGDVLRPYFPVTCFNCGNTVFVDALKASIHYDPRI